jgi:hypothetical protein
MLSDWVSRSCAELELPDMSPRHAPEILFRPDVCNIRFNDDDELVIFKLSGPRVIAGAPMMMVVDSWEWDWTRDAVTELAVAVVAWVASWYR